MSALLEGREPVLLRGDATPIVAALAELSDCVGAGGQGTPDATDRIRVTAMVSSLARPQGEASPHRLARRLRGQLHEDAEQARRLPRLRHLLLILDTGELRPVASAKPACLSLAERTHARLETTCARFVTVTVLLADGCTEPGAVARRLRERIADSARDPAFALFWDEALEAPIAVLAARVFC